jgi:ribosomal protein S12 methylthiotransferase accessory factor
VRELIGFKRHLRTEIVRGEAVYLFSENGVTALRGPHVELIAPLLDGTRDLTTLLSEMPEHVPAEHVGRVLTRLGAAGLICTRGPDDHPGDPATRAATLAYWDAAGLDAACALTSTTTARVRLVAVGGAETDAMARSLRRAGLVLSAEDEQGAALTVVVCDDYLTPGLREVEESHRATGTPWLLTKPTGTQVWVGPIFTPGDGACWRCLATRLSANRPAEAHVQARRGQHGPAARPDVRLPSVTATAVEVAALEATKWLAGHRHPGQREVWVCDSLTLRTSHHQVRALPQCPDCGDPDLVRQQAYRPVVIGTRPKRSRDGGGHRSATPGEVLDAYRHLISPITGVVKEVRRDSRGPSVFHSYRSGLNHAASGGFEGLRSTLRCENGGKGVTALDAEVGALCEALERYSAGYKGDEARVRGSFRTLGDEAVHPDTFQLYHPRQFEHRAEWNTAHSAFQHVAEPFDENAVLDWTPVWSMTNQCHKLMPTSALYYGAPTPGSIVASSNGCAAGSSIEDATLQGVLELVERDAVALWWYNRSSMPAVDLDAAGDPFVDELREVYAELGRELWVLDLTSDLGVPVLAAVSRRIDGPQEDIMFGFGAHLDPRCALRRALTELNQVMPAILCLDEGGRRALDVDLRDWLGSATVENQPYLAPSGATAPRHSYSRQPDLGEDVRAVRERIEMAGMELLVLDQTRPDVGLPVVKAIVPGMRHFWSRLAQGRLYDVPVALGRAKRPATYDELNPIPMFM